MTTLLNHLPGLSWLIIAACVWLVFVLILRRSTRTTWEWVAYVAAGLWLLLWVLLDWWPRKRAKP